YWRVSPPSRRPSPRLAERALFSSMPMKRASKCTAASSSAPCSPRAAAERRAARLPVSTTGAKLIGKPLVAWRYRCACAGRSPSDDDELGAQRAGLAQRLEDRDEIARRRADLVHRLDDVVQRHAGLEQEQPAPG